MSSDLNLLKDELRAFVDKNSGDGTLATPHAYHLNDVLVAERLRKAEDRVEAAQRGRKPSSPSLQR